MGIALLVNDAGGGPTSTTLHVLFIIRGMSVAVRDQPGEVHIIPAAQPVFFIEITITL